MRAAVTVLLNAVLIVSLLAWFYKLNALKTSAVTTNHAAAATGKQEWTGLSQHEKISLAGPTDNLTSVKSHSTSLPRSQAQDQVLHEYVKRLHGIRVLCWVLTGPTTVLDRGQAVLETWGRRCSKLLFMTSERDKSAIPGRVSLPGVVEGRRGLPMKARMAWLHVWENYGQEYDWFYKSDDDTYTIVENLRLLLSGHTTQSQPYYTGKVLRSDGITYASGGAGYVLNRAALLKLNDVIGNGCMDNSPIMHEDQLVASCLRKAGVALRDSHDGFGANRFMPLSPDLHLRPGRIGRSHFNWLYSNAVPPNKNAMGDVLDGPQCCSELAVSFHYIKPDMQYALDYLIYRLHVFGTRISDNQFV